MPRFFSPHPPSILRRLIRAQQARLTRHATLRELRTMADWQLADIGIAREQIADVAAAMTVREGCRGPAIVTAIEAHDHAAVCEAVTTTRGTRLAA